MNANATLPEYCYGSSKAVLEYLIKTPAQFITLLDGLLNTPLLTSHDRQMVFSLKRNLELGMQARDVASRLFEVASDSPKFAALLLATAVYRFEA